MEEVIGSIPIRSTKHPLKYSKNIGQLFSPASLSLFSNPAFK
jgi:hypothetical protein